MLWSESNSQLPHAILEERIVKKSLEPILFQSMLPLDILRLVFVEYGQQETLQHPLETLLLVCKAWTRLCLESPLIWSMFNIVLSTGSEAKQWVSLVPRRLAKGGPTVPLYITIVNERRKSHRNRDEEGELRRVVCPTLTMDIDPSPDKECHCSSEISDAISSILQILSGPNGDLCSRWTVLQLHLHLSAHQADFLKSLVYPTPNLRELTIQGISNALSAYDSIFPSTPNLRDLSLMHNSIADSQSNHGLLRAGPVLERLEVQQYTSTFVNNGPQTFPHLKSLVIRGTWSRLHALGSSISVPNLTSFTSEMNFLTMSSPELCFIIPFEKLNTLGIFFLGFRPNTLQKQHPSFTAGMISLLSKASNVEKIAGDGPSIWTLLFVLSMSPQPAGLHLTASQLTVCVVERRNCSRIESALNGSEDIYVIGTGETRMADIERIKKLRGWSLRNPQDWVNS